MFPVSLAFLLALSSVKLAHVHMLFVEQIGAEELDALLRKASWKHVSSLSLKEAAELFIGHNEDLFPPVRIGGRFEVAGIDPMFDGLDANLQR
jgi:hypothetical protein